MKPAQPITAYDQAQDAEEDITATAYPPSGSGRGREGLPPSEDRRREQKKVSSDNKGSPWEQWKEIGRSSLGWDVQTDRVSTEYQ